MTRVFEGFNIFGKKIEFTDNHEEIMNTSLKGDMTYKTAYIYDIQDNIEVYSLFKRLEIEDTYYHPYDRVSDGNPVLYALKNEGGWKFCNLKNLNKFWFRFEQILKKFLNDHKNMFDTVLCIPSSNHLNKDIINSIKKIANSVGIKHIVTEGLKTMKADDVFKTLLEPDSYFRKRYNNEYKFNNAINDIKKSFVKMNNENNGIFKYHLISNETYRRLIVNTLYVDETYDYEYQKVINDNNVLIVDDSITLGQSIKNCIHAITNTYNPKSISVLTMFSELFDKYGNEARDWEDTIYGRNV